MSAELVKLLTAARHALLSYAHGNSSPDLATGIAAKIDEVIAAAPPRAEQSASVRNDAAAPDQIRSAWIPVSEQLPALTTLDDAPLFINGQRCAPIWWSDQVVVTRANSLCRYDIVQVIAKEDKSDPQWYPVSDVTHWMPIPALRDTATPSTSDSSEPNAEADLCPNEAPPDVEQLVQWLRNQYDRHHEIEDKLAADALERFYEHRSE